jgi:hypothetical protein
MKKSHEIWMAALTMMAVVLAVVLIAGPQRPAEAAMLNSQNTYSLMTAGTPGGDEFLFVVDKAQQKMAIYHVGNQIELVGGRDFGRLFQNAPQGR